MNTDKANRPSMMARVVHMVFLCAVTLAASEVRAEQPIFDEMPRWNDGYGLQVLHEFISSKTLLDEEGLVPGEQSEEAHLLHLQGVYTWNKAFRFTAKVPIVLNARLTSPGETLKVGPGLGDVTLALPFKKYFNLDGRSGSWTLTPQMTVPGGSRSDDDFFSRKPGNGLSLGYSTETYRYHIGASVTGRLFYVGEPSELESDLSLGLNVQALGSSGHIKWKTALIQRSDASYTLRAGPVLYWRLSDTYHAQLLIKHDLLDRRAAGEDGQRTSIRVGLAAVF